MHAPSISAQTGWKRRHPAELCQALEALERVTQFDYDLRDEGFLFYAAQRGVLWYAGRQDSPRWDFLVSKGDQSEFDSPGWQAYFGYAQEYPPDSGQRYQYTEAELESQWRTIQYAKARLQDCWELYLQDEDIMRLWTKPRTPRPAVAVTLEPEFTAGKHGQLSLF